MKNTLVDLLKAKGFAVVPYKAEAKGIMLRRSWEKEVEVVWYGKRTYNAIVETVSYAGYEF